MAKFVMECPNCGRYVEARTGFFARKTIDCACGYTIHVRTEKLSSRRCPHCGNDVVFDQSKGKKAKCPVCGEPINTLVAPDKMVEFSCKQCGVRLVTARTTPTYTCPVCDFVNNVAERAKTEEIRKDGLASIIKYEGDNETLVWKHPVEDFNMGSQLIVHESQEAVFFKDGQALDLFGAGRYTLETQKLPLLEKIYKLPTDTEATFHSEVYFINMATQMGIKWGTDSKVRLFDPASGLHLELGASGEFNIRVTDSRKLLLKVVGTTGGLGQDQLLGNGNSKGIFRSMVMTHVKSYLAAAIRENGINVLEIDERLVELSDALRDKINVRLAEYGLTMPEFFVSRIVTPDDDPNYRKMKEQFAEQYLGVRQEQIRKNIARAEAERKAVEAETEAQMKIIGARGEAEALKIQKKAEAESYQMQAEAEAAEMRMKGYTYQQETARKVGMEAMQNGITGNSAGGGALGDVASLGVTLGAMGSVIGMTKEAVAPAMEGAAQIGQGATAPLTDSWECPKCGRKQITTKFCPDCGAPRPAPVLGWTCPDCGQTNITSNFCPNCGRKKPEPEKGWTCPKCGHPDILTNFCPDCGTAKPEPEKGWTCPDCGQQDIHTNFCPNCGRKKGETGNE